MDIVLSFPSDCQPDLCLHFSLPLLLAWNTNPPMLISLLLPLIFLPWVPLLRSFLSGFCQVTCLVVVGAGGRSKKKKKDGSDVESSRAFWDG